MPPALRAIVLDLDGTLVDSAAELASALNAGLAPLGRRPLAVEEVRGMIGDGIHMLTRRALEATGGIPDGAAFDDALGAVRHAYDRLPASRPYGGVPETLERLHADGWTLGVCTNKPSGPASRLLLQLGFDRWVTALAGGDTFAVKKPDPGHVTGLLDLMGTRPENAVMVGDSANDALAARAAGLPFVAVGYGYCKGPVGTLGADMVIGDFPALPDALARLAARTG